MPCEGIDLNNINFDSMKKYLIEGDNNIISGIAIHSFCHQQTKSKTRL